MIRQFVRGLPAALLLFASCMAAPPVRHPSLPVPLVFPSPDACVPAWEPLAPGIDYFPFAVEVPRLEAHAVRVDLAHPDVSILVSPGDGPPGHAKSVFVSSFLRDAGCAVAVNGTPFAPSSAVEGEDRALTGLSVSSGALVSPPDPRYAALVFRAGPRASVEAQDGFSPTPDIENAVGGFFIVLKQGVPGGHPERRFPRTAAGVSSDGSLLYLLVVDGRRARSVGATEPETGRLLERLGALDGLILDGGGSSALALRGPGGEPSVVNRPVHGGFPGRERAVGNVLGILSKMSGDR